MSIWSSIPDVDLDLTPIDRDNYTGKPEPGGGKYFVDVATATSYHECIRVVIRRYESLPGGTDMLMPHVVLLLTRPEAAELAERLDRALDGGPS